MIFAPSRKQLATEYAKYNDYARNWQGAGTEGGCACLMMQRNAD